MEIKSTPWPRLAPWLVLLVAAFAAGRWHATARRDQHYPPVLPPALANDQPAGGPAAVSAARDRIIAAAQRLREPDASIAALFENLTVEDATAIATQLLQMSTGPSRDPLFLLAMRRWGEFDAPAALARTNSVENLPLRAAARKVVYEVWGRHDAAAAFAAASAEARERDRDHALTALIGGAASVSASSAIATWENSPVSFRASSAGDDALTRIAEAAGGIPERASLQGRIAEMAPGAERIQLTAALARHWGRHEPEAAVAWLKSVTPPGAIQDAMVDEVFVAFVRHDPVRAATWATQQADERRRNNYVAAAAAAWATYDSAGAETWVNEQQHGSYLDGAAAAIAAHFIEQREWPQAFAWTRRILRNEARAELLGNLGRLWQAEQPEEFATFLAQTSLNRVELEMLRSKIVEIASP